MAMGFQHQFRLFQSVVKSATNVRISVQQCDVENFERASFEVEVSWPVEASTVVTTLRACRILRVERQFYGIDRLSRDVTLRVTHSSDNVVVRYS